MKGIVGTLVSGAIGLAALYVVGKIAFKAGHDIAEAECRYEQLKRGIEKKEAIQEENAEEESEVADDVVPPKKPGKFSKLWGLKKQLFGKDGFVRNPESHVIEAQFKGREIHLNVKPKGA